MKKQILLFHAICEEKKSNTTTFILKPPTNISYKEQEVVQNYIKTLQDK